MGIDEVGIDKVGIDKVGITPTAYHPVPKPGHLCLPIVPFLRVQDLSPKCIGPSDILVKGRGPATGINSN